MASIGVFDSGYGGLTIFKSIVEKLPQYDYIYLGDNARAPYGNRSYEIVYEYTLECVDWLFKQGCELVILACNTASAKALRSIQRNDLKKWGDTKRVLGVIRPTAQIVGSFTKSRHIGILGTSGTVNSGSYLIEIGHFSPDIIVKQHACPLWVPLIEENAFDTDAAEWIIKSDVLQLLSDDPNIDTILLACTHYPILMEKIKKYVPENVTLLSQGDLVAESLADYLQRHPSMDAMLAKNGKRHFYTTGDEYDFDAHTQLFYGVPTHASHCNVLKN